MSKHLPENRARWMKLLGNSVSVPVIEVLAKAIIETGVFDLPLVEEVYSLQQELKELQMMALIM
ncbi:MAG: hypothetical protein MUF58_06390 [Arcicella sp.]|jgi:DNA (cytosine-5)-methyltransferase 1|nr:hypothetical protein [Arcicella sp.]